MNNRKDIVDSSNPDCEMIAFCTLPDRESAEHMAEAIIKSNLAACVQVGEKVLSYYIWKGEECKSIETPLTIKFMQSDTDMLFELVKKNHPYECPEWICVKADSIYSAYAAWMKKRGRGV